MNSGRRYKVVVRARVGASLESRAHEVGGQTLAFGGTDERGVVLMLAERRVVRAAIAPWERGHRRGRRRRAGGDEGQREPREAAARAHERFGGRQSLEFMDNVTGVVREFHRGFQKVEHQSWFCTVRGWARLADVASEGEGNDVWGGLTSSPTTGDPKAPTVLMPAGVWLRHTGSQVAFATSERSLRLTRVSLCLPTPWGPLEVQALPTLSLATAASRLGERV